MAKELDAQLVDRRTVDRNIQKGLLTREAYQSYLDGLSDAESNVELVSLEEEEETAEGSEAEGSAEASAEGVAEATPEA